MYDDLHTAGVLPSCSAVRFTAAVASLRRSVTPSTDSACRRARRLAQIIVPAQVRKSLAENRSPINSLMSSLIMRRVTLTSVPSPFRNLKSWPRRTFFSSRTMRATRRSRSSRTCRFRDFPA